MYEDGGLTRFCFLGKFSHRLDIKTVIEAARIAEDAGSRVQVVLCGTGESVDANRALAADIDCVVFSGWVDRPKIWSLMRRSHYGLLPYPDTFDFALSYPNKVGEYLSAGLPIISSTRGAVEVLLESRKCGHSYGHQNARELAQLIERCAGRESDYEGRAANARVTFEALFDLDQVYGVYCDFLEELANAGRHAWQD